MLVANGVEHFELEGTLAGLVGDSVTTRTDHAVMIMLVIDNLYRRAAGVAPRRSEPEEESIWPSG
jgi:hypothetical protein